MQYFKKFTCILPTLMRKDGVSGSQSKENSNIAGGTIIDKDSACGDSMPPAPYAKRMPQLKSTSFTLDATLI